MIEISSQKIDRAALLLRNVPGGIHKALYNTVKRTMVTVKAKAATEITKHYRISAAQVKKSSRMKDRITSGMSMTGTITFAGNVIPLINFAVRYGSGGLVTASVMKKSGGAALKHAFVANLQHGTGVFERTLPKRASSVQLYGPSVAHMMGNEDVLAKIEAAASSTAEKRLEHEITRILNGYGGRL